MGLTTQPKITVGFKRLNDNAVIPTKAFPTDSGFDLVASEDVIVEPGETKLITTGIAVQLPPGYEAQVRPRSGVTSRTKLRVQLGTIDNAYRGEIGVIVDNIHAEDEADKRTHNPVLLNGYIYADRGRYPKNTYLIRKGDRIAQLAVQALPRVEAIEIEDVGASERGSAGFGSSGVSSE